MNPVIGLDVAKGESEVQAFLDKDKPFGKSFSVKHTKEDLDSLIFFLREIEGHTGVRPAFMSLPASQHPGDFTGNTGFFSKNK
ncbi:hypothetical protein M3205_24265 [Cytobacillus firmus]|uniref:hypothetical protein n=1 Tax=Cytobacillus sp. FSL R5-0596 TaxID=2954696 RepID=UPI00203FC819|nr:hypothetical protein [Cytobacillus firmus]MCM3708761.1 hypothetical protein [Cytobacillus firmus]